MSSTLEDLRLHVHRKLPLLHSHLLIRQQLLLQQQPPLLQLLANMFPSLNSAAIAVVPVAASDLMCGHVKMTVGVHGKSAPDLMYVHSAKMPLLRDRMHPQPVRMALQRLLIAGIFLKLFVLIIYLG
nr:unnamed protein product [Digitaria exilis]